MLHNSQESTFTYSTSARLNKACLVLFSITRAMVAVLSRVLSVTLLSFLTTTSNAFVPASQSAAAASSTTNLFVASAESRADVSELGRGMGGRIEEAFAAAKAKGEAAFVSFVTAGYPTAQGE